MSHRTNPRKRLEEALLRRDPHESTLPDFQLLEDRILMSASPIDDGGDPHPGPGDEIGELIAPLSGGEGMDAPTSTGIPDQFFGEDANNSVINLAEFFSDAQDPSDELTFVVLDNSNPELFTSVAPAGSTLEIDYAPDAFGEATITVRAIDSDGMFVDDEFQLSVIPMNDRPTTTGLFDVTVDEDAGSTVIDLFASFDDVEDADAELTFSVSEITNPELFSSVVIDAVAGTLTLDYAPDANGTSQITLRATDTDGAYVEMSSGAADRFTIYDEYTADGIHGPDIGIQGTNLVTHWWLFFRDENGRTTDEPNLDGLAQFMQSPHFKPGQPIILNIEHHAYGNTPEGRDNLAQMLEAAATVAGDLPLGIYRIMPERNWYAPVNYARAHDDVDAGLASGHALNFDVHERAYENWLARNELFRTETVSAEFGGGVLADYVNTIYPSLYTFFRSGYREGGPPALSAEVQVDSESNSFSISDTTVVDGLKIYLRKPVGGEFPSGLMQAHYYVVNADDGSFQLSETQGGDAIDFGDGASERLFVAFHSRTHLEHDPVVHYWEDYARLSIEEAQKFGKDVIPLLSPGYRGEGDVYMEKDFFRIQLDTVFETGADGVTIWNIAGDESAMPQNQNWWEALTEFDDYINSPTQFTVTVNSVNDAPTTTGIIDVVLEGDDLIYAVDLHSVFSDVEDTSAGLSYAVSHISEPDAVFTSSIDPVTGNLSITFSPTFSGSTNITITATDSDGAAVDTTFQATLAGGGPSAPVLASDDFFGIDEDAPTGPLTSSVLLNDVFTPGEASVTLVDGPANAEDFQLNADGTFVYSPTSNYFGRDAFTYLLTNDDGVSSQATVTIDVLPQNDAPVATGSPHVVVDEDTPLATVDLWGLFEDVDNVDGQLTFSVTSVSNPTLFDSLVVDPASGRLLITLVPHANGFGVLTVEPRDLQGEVATASVDVTVRPVDDAPLAQTDAFFLEEEQILHVSAVDGLLSNDLDLEGDALFVQLVSAPAHANQFQLLPDGSFSYQPDPDFDGVDTFTYRASDGLNVSTETQVTLFVADVNDAPVAQGTEISVELGTEVAQVALSQVFSDVDTPFSSLSFSVISTSGAPVITSVTAHKSGFLDIELDPDQAGTATIVVRATDTGDLFADAEITLDVFDPNQTAPPIADDDLYQIVGQRTVTAAQGVLSNDVDPEAGTLSVELVSGPAHEEFFELGSDGSFTYVATEGYSGVDSFVYRVIDESGASSTATASLNVLLPVDPGSEPPQTDVPPTTTPEPDTAPNAFGSFLISAFLDDGDQGLPASGSVAEPDDQLQSIALSMDPIDMNVERFDEFDQSRPTRQLWNTPTARGSRAVQRHDPIVGDVSMDEDLAQVDLAAQFVPVLTTSDATDESATTSTADVPESQPVYSADSDDVPFVDNSPTQTSELANEDTSPESSLMAAQRTPNPMSANAQ